MSNSNKSTSTEISVKSNKLQRLTAAEMEGGLQFTANFSILKTELQAIYEVKKRNNKDYKSILVAPVNMDMPSKMLVKDFFVELHTTYGMSDEKVTSMKEQIKAVIGETKAAQLDDISIEINAIFLYMPPAENTEPATANSETEYAFSVQMDFGDFGQIGPVSINRIGFSIWNTQREGVIRKMNLVSIAEKLSELDK